MDSESLRILCTFILECKAELRKAGFEDDYVRNSEPIMNAAMARFIAGVPGTKAGLEIVNLLNKGAL